MYFAVFVITAWLLFVCVPPAFAYLDPGSGSMIVQLLLGGVAGVAVLVRLYWHQLLTLIRFKNSKNDSAS